MLDGVPVYLSNADRKSGLLSSYMSNYERMARDNRKRSNLDHRYIRYQSMNFAEYAPRLAGLDICELGLGQGFLVRELLARGAERVTAVDISPSYLREFAGHPSVTPVLANAERLPFVDAFDLVFCSDVMEHVLNLSSFLICLNQAIRVGGFACVRVPYRENLMLYSPYVGCPYEFAHLRSFNKDLLGIYFGDAGFSITRIGLDGFLLETPRRVYTDTMVGRLLYKGFRSFVRKICRDEFEVTRWNSRFASLLMRPYEIVVLARKGRTIVPSLDGAYQLI